jgi:hypothetical protein
VAEAAALTPVLALVPLPPHTDLENVAVTTHATFQAIIRRAEKRYRAEGGRRRRSGSSPISPVAAARA